jgi:hypothetical protein
MGHCIEVPMALLQSLGIFALFLRGICVAAVLAAALNNMHLEMR